MENSSEPLFLAGGTDAPRPELPLVERNAITAIVRNSRTGKYIGLKWKQVDWDTFITGGIEDGQTAEQAARTEVHEETGYKNLKLITELPRFHSKFYHKPKGENRFAHFQSFLFELEDEEKDPLSNEEVKKHEVVWLSEDELVNFRLPEGHRYLINYVLDKGL